MRAKSLISLYIFLSLLFHVNAQEIEVIQATQTLRGVSDFNEGYAYFGIGIVWADKDGVVYDKTRIIKGLPDSKILNILPDKNKGLWVLTNKGVGRIDSLKNAQTIFNIKAFDNGSFKDIHVDENGELWCLMTNRIIHIKQNNQYYIYFETLLDNSSYFQKLDRDDKGNIYLANRNNFFVLNSEKILKEIPLEKKLTIQKVQVIPNGNVIILDYNDIYEYRNDEIRGLIRGRDIYTGLKIFDGVFNAEDDYWLLANEGTVYHNYRGKWQKFNPPSKLITGNFEEDLRKTANGHIWMTLRNQIMMKYDGLNWTEIDFDQKAQFKFVKNAKLIHDKNLIAMQGIDNSPVAFKDGGFQLIPGIPREKVFDINFSENGDLFWSGKNSLNKVVNDTSIPILNNVRIDNFGLINDEIIYVSDGKMHSLKAGVSSEISSDIHHFGTSSLQGFYLNFFQSFKKELLLTYKYKPGLIIKYDGNDWEKIIAIEGKKIGSIKNIVSFNNSTYIITDAQNIAKYDSNGLHWIHFEMGNLKSYLNSYICNDGSLWVLGKNGKMSVYREDKRTHFDLLMGDDRFDRSFQYVVSLKSNVYHIMLDGALLECTF